MEPNFSAYPFERLRRVRRRDAQVESVIAQWLAARPSGDRLATLVGGPVRAEIMRAGAPRSFDPYAAACELRIAGVSFELYGAGAGVRRLAQRLIGGPAELDAARPVTPAEHAMFALVVAAAVEDLAIAGEVWPRLEAAPPVGTFAPEVAEVGLGPTFAIELAVELAGIALTIVAIAPHELPVRAPPVRPLAGWTDRVFFDLSIVLGRCAIDRAAVAALALRDVITLERAAGAAELVVAGGAVGLHVAPGAVVAEVATGYVARDMSLQDVAHIELTVGLGSARLSLRQVSELAVGQIVPLGRPLAGPFEVRAGGQLVGRGELVDVDGELGVRIVSLGD